MVLKYVLIKVPHKDPCCLLQESDKIPTLFVNIYLSELYLTRESGVWFFKIYVITNSNTTNLLHKMTNTNHTCIF